MAIDQSFLNSVSEKKCKCSRPKKTVVFSVLYRHLMIKGKLITLYQLYLKSLFRALLQKILLTRNRERRNAKCGIAKRRLLIMAIEN